MLKINKVWLMNLTFERSFLPNYYKGREITYRKSTNCRAATAIQTQSLKKQQKAAEFWNAVDESK
jgi:hypothetical protein